MRPTLALLLQALIPALALEHDYFASYYGNEGTENKWSDPDSSRRTDMWPPSDKGEGRPPPTPGAEGTVTKYGNEEIYWGAHPPPHSEAYYGYDSHYPPMMTTTMKPTTTAPPPPKDTGIRVSKQPYSYYFIGRKLWYIPLYFAIYYTLYVGALIIKAIARHRVNVPPGYGRSMQDTGLASLVGNAIHSVARRYM